MIETLAETGSTNADLLARLAAGDHCPEGRWLVTDRQTAGRGRQGRIWEDGGKGNFMGSTVVRPGPHDPPAATLAFLAGLAVYETLAEIAPDPSALSLKWPNDVLLGGAKLAGILLEGQGGAVVVGIGVNLAVAPDVPGRKVTALGQYGPAPGRDHFARNLDRHWDRELERWRQAGLPSILRRWEKAAHPQGTPLTVHEPGGATISGAYAGLAEDGALRLRLADGAVTIVHAGDVDLA